MGELSNNSPHLFNCTINIHWIHPSNCHFQFSFFTSTILKFFFKSLLIVEINKSNYLLFGVDNLKKGTLKKKKSTVAYIINAEVTRPVTIFTTLSLFTDTTIFVCLRPRVLVSTKFFFWSYLHVPHKQILSHTNCTVPPRSTKTKKRGQRISFFLLHYK